MFPAMAGFNRLSLPAEFYDRTSVMMLRAPEPQYLWARLAFMADASAELRRVGDIGLPGRTIGSDGAPVPMLADMQALISDDIRAEAIMTCDELATGVGHTIRFNRPVFGGGGYTAASRTIARGTAISTTPIDVTAEQVSLTVNLHAGPFASGGSVPQPYMISSIDSKRAVHSLVQLAGLHLSRDRMKFVDAVYGGLFDPFGTSSSSILFPGDPGNATTADSAAVFPTAGNRPFDLELLLRTEQVLKSANIMPFANGRYMAVITPLQSKQLLLDPEFQRLAAFMPDVNALKTAYVRTVSTTDVFVSSTNTIDTSTVSGQSIQHGTMFGPGAVCRCTSADGCFTASPTDDNYGFDAKVMWFALEAEGTLDVRFIRGMHSN